MTKTIKLKLTPKAETFRLVRVPRRAYDELRRRQRPGQSLGGVIMEILFPQDKE